MTAGVVRPSARALSRLRPLDVADVSIVSGFWAARQRINRDATIPHGYRQLGAAGTLDNFRLAAGAKGTYKALSDNAGFTFPFLDSDVYKWLEAAGWELGRAPDPGLAASAEEAIALIAAAQRPDGYVNSYVQVVTGGEPYRDLAWGHEFYCIGHLIQAAVAWHRVLGDDRLLAIAVRAADAVDRTFGPSRRDGIDGHPIIEMALVELSRVTGERRYLALASRLIELRGRGLLGDGRFGAAYWQDHAPVREATTVAGHAVRQMYLDAGAVDVAVETGDERLLEAVRRRWDDLVRTRSYLTGGLGSRSRDEAFGDPYELPPDLAYAETCAAISSVMLAWRLLLATGEPVYADAIERTIYNGILSGLGQDGTRFFYENVLQRRTHRVDAPAGRGERAAWFPCACCPPNLMRLLSSWQQYLATSDGEGVQIHQYASAEIRASVTGGPVRLAMETDYPWDGKVQVRILETPSEPWTLSLRLPGWYRGSADGEVAGTGPGAARTLHRRRSWAPGDTVSIDLDMAVRVVQPAPEVDAIRGCIAVERGPLVYCIETADAPTGIELEDLRFDPTRSVVAEPRPDIGEPVVGVRIPVVVRPDRPASSGDGPAVTTIGAVPYHAWANRTVEAMRVWIPTAGSDPTPETGDEI